MRTPSRVLTVAAVPVLLAGCESSMLAPSPADAPSASLAAATRQGTTARATGSGEITQRGEEGSRRTFAFSAVRLANGETVGQIEVTNRAQGIRLHARVVCVRVNGGFAQIGAVVTQSQPDESRIGAEVVVAAVDNGTGPGAPPDQLSGVNFLTSGSATDYCAADYPNFGLRYDVTAGEITVR